MNTFLRVDGIVRLTRNPELKYTPSGTPLANIGMASNHTYVSNGEKKEEVCFADGVVFGKSAEAVAQYTSKGSLVHITGRLSYRRWQTEDGQNRSKLEIVVDRVIFLDKKDDTDGSEEEQGPQ